MRVEMALVAIKLDIVMGDAKKNELEHQARGFLRFSCVDSAHRR